MKQTCTTSVCHYMETGLFSFTLTKLLTSVMTVNSIYCFLTWIQLSFQKIRNELVEIKIGRDKS